MKKNISAVWLSLLAVLVLVSCKDTAEEVVLSSDCYISSFTLGMVRRTETTTSSTGEDSVYTVAYNAGSYAMRIDQLAGRIENPDSLPVNSITRAVLASVQTTGTVMYRKEEEADGWRAYSETDSIDFSVPLVFRVISADGSAMRDYRVQVNVHRMDGNVFVWNRLAGPELWTGADRLNVLVWNGSAWVFARVDGAVRVFRSDADAGVQWEEVKAAGCGDADVKTLTAFGGRLYMTGGDGSLLVSDDARQWSPVAADRSGLRLLTADGEALYALGGAARWRSADGVQWTEEELDDEAAFLPVQDVSAVAYLQADGLRRVLLAGNRSAEDWPDDAGAVVWSRGTKSAGASARWMYYNLSSDNAYACPRLSGLEVLHYNGLLLVCGGSPADDAETEKLDIRVSRDNGVTWKREGVYALPDDAVAAAGPFAVTADGQHYVWLVRDGRIWRGRLNKLGFRK